ncbi:MAG: response regulator [Anaerolineales bacterium]
MTITVFLADDHAVVRDGLRYLLDAQPDIAVVGVAGNGRSAIQEVETLRPNVVILDIAMPEMNGITAAEHIRERVPDSRIIILSMHSTSEHIFRALRAGAHGYLVKESAAQEVVSAVRGVQAGERYLSSEISNRIIEDYLLHRGLAEEQQSPLERLSARELEVLQFVVEGRSSAQIAEILRLSPKTVETYRGRIMQKLDIHDLPTLVKFAIQYGLTSLE